MLYYTSYTRWIPRGQEIVSDFDQQRKKDQKSLKQLASKRIGWKKKLNKLPESFSHDLNTQLKQTSE